MSNRLLTLRSRIVSGAVVLIVLTVLAGLLIRTASHAVSDARRDRVVDFNYAQSTSPDLVFLADHLGYFRGTRLRPHYVTPVAAAQIVPLVASGDLDFGQRMAPLVISAIGSRPCRMA